MVQLFDSMAKYEQLGSKSCEWDITFESKYLLFLKTSMSVPLDRMSVTATHCARIPTVVMCAVV